MITKELARELKDAGFPQEYRKTDIAMDWIYDESGELIMIHDDNDTEWWLGQDYTVTFDEELLKKEYIKCPTLSELIEACDNLCHDLAIFSDGDGWRCGDYMPYEHDWVVRIENKDLDTAMALLWLELNKK